MERRPGRTPGAHGTSSCASLRPSSAWPATARQTPKPKADRGSYRSRCCFAILAIRAPNSSSRRQGCSAACSQCSPRSAGSSGGGLSTRSTALGIRVWLASRASPTLTAGRGGDNRPQGMPWPSSNGGVRQFRPRPGWTRTSRCTAADRSDPLAADDLEQFATPAYGLGRESECHARAPRAVHGDPSGDTR